MEQHNLDYAYRVVTHEPLQPQWIRDWYAFVDGYIRQAGITDMGELLDSCRNPGDRYTQMNCGTHGDVDMGTQVRAGGRSLKRSTGSWPC